MTKTQEEIDSHTPDSEWEKIEDAGFFQFQKVGDSIEGKLIEIGRSERYNMGMYNIEDNKGDRIRFHGSKQLDDLLLACKLGDFIRVEYIDQENLPNGTLKIFNVMRKKK